jgi:hypothetical protein
MKKNSQEKKKVDQSRNINKNKASDMEKVKPEYTSEELDYIIYRF